MAMAGAAAAEFVNSLKGEVSGGSKVKIDSRLSDEELEAIHASQHRDVTHHYKITRTQSHSVEIDDTSDVNKLSTDDKKVEKSKSKGSGCFGWCFGKKG